MMTWLREGGPAAWSIIAVGAAATGVFIERWLFLRRARVPIDDFLQGIFNVVRRRNLLEGIALCDETPGPVARLVRAALLKAGEGGAAARAAMIESGSAELPGLEQRVDSLAGMARLASVLGMLGSVLGLMQSLDALHRRAPLVHAGDLARGLWSALMCAALGLAVAAMAWAGRQVLVGMVEALVVDMEEALGRVTEELDREDARRARRDGAP